MTARIYNLRLEAPVTGSYGWHLEWARNMDTLDAHPGIRPIAGGVFPETPWPGQLVFDLTTKQLHLYTGLSWRSVVLI